MRFFFCFLLFLSFSFESFSQANLLNARVPQDVGEMNEQQKIANNRDPLEYGYVDDRDVIWSKTIWEVIDLDERINFPFYYPIDTTSLAPDRRSLFHVLKMNIEKKNIKEVYAGPYFREKLTPDEIAESLIYIDTTDIAIEEFNSTGVWLDEFIFKYPVTPKYIRQYVIKGTWYFDKRLGELKYRLLGLSPVAVNPRRIREFESNPTCCGDDAVPLFWVWFPDARESLNKNKVFNSKNSSQPITYDHMLNSRRFNSLIYKEENVYQDRDIKDYISDDALRMLLESERIKSVIRDFEQDMWNN